jgi:hypothetical protein
MRSLLAGPKTERRHGVARPKTAQTGSPSVRRLQSACGNQAVARLLERRGPGEARSCECAPVGRPRAAAGRAAKQSEWRPDRYCDRREEAVERIRLYARAMIGSAISTLGQPAAMGTPYAVALARHFRDPTPAQRTAIRDTYARMLRRLTYHLLVCGSPRCGNAQAFYWPFVDKIHLCRGFWAQPRPCPAVILIHETAHAADVDARDPHAPNRGHGSYPLGAAAPRPVPSAGQRMGNADAYAFFAAHVHLGRDVPSSCFRVGPMR